MATPQMSTRYPGDGPLDPIDNPEAWEDNGVDQNERFDKPVRFFDPAGQEYYAQRHNDPDEDYTLTSQFDWDDWTFVKPQDLPDALTIPGGGELDHHKPSIRLLSTGLFPRNDQKVSLKRLQNDRRVPTKIFELGAEMLEDINKAPWTESTVLGDPSRKADDFRLTTHLGWIQPSYRRPRQGLGAAPSDYAFDRWNRGENYRLTDEELHPAVGSWDEDSARILQFVPAPENKKRWRPLQVGNLPSRRLACELPAVHENTLPMPSKHQQPSRLAQKKKSHQLFRDNVTAYQRGEEPPYPNAEIRRWLRRQENQPNMSEAQDEADMAMTEANTHDNEDTPMDEADNSIRTPQHAPDNATFPLSFLSLTFLFPLPSHQVLLFFVPGIAPGGG